MGWVTVPIREKTWVCLVMMVTHTCAIFYLQSIKDQCSDWNCYAGSLSNGSASECPFCWLQGTASRNAGYPFHRTVLYF